MTLKTNLKTRPHDHPALLQERSKMLEERRRKLLQERQLYAKPERYEFGDIRPMHRPVYQPPKDRPARPGAMDFAAIPSKGF